MAFYARLKKGIIESPYYGKFVYPSESYTQLEDKYLSIAQKDERLEIINQEQMTEVKQKEQEQIDDIVNGQWKQSEKRIATIDNRDTLNQILVRARALNKNKIAEITQDRIDELTVK